MRHWLMLIAALLPGMAAASGQELSLGGTLFSASGLSLALPSRPGLEAAYAYEFDAWRLGGGVRWGMTDTSKLPLELYVRAQLSAGQGVWRPLVGPELGLSGLTVVTQPRGGIPDDYPKTRAERFGPAYIAIHAAPLRFAFNRFTVSALELHWGTLLSPMPGSLLRLQLGFVRLGVKL